MQEAADAEYCTGAMSHGAAEINPWYGTLLYLGLSSPGYG